MPKNAVNQRSEIIEYLSSEIFKLKTSKKIEELLNKLTKIHEHFSLTDKRIISLAKKSFDETKKFQKIDIVLLLKHVLYPLMLGKKLKKKKILKYLNLT